MHYENQHGIAKCHLKSDKKKNSEKDEKQMIHDIQRDICMLKIIICPKLY